MQHNRELLKAQLLFIFFLFPVILFSQQLKDTLAKKDSTAAALHVLLPDSSAHDTVIVAAPKPAATFFDLTDSALARSTYLNAAAQPVSTVSKEMGERFNNWLFYIVLSLIIVLAFFRFFYERYFNNLFRVFFNTSLRQSQLTDQLLQAKQVSLFFNMLFVISGGIYIYLLLLQFKLIQQDSIFSAIGACCLGVAVIYFLKFISLKFTGWLTGFETAAGTYLFIIFLINKILGILLIPFVVIMAFGDTMLRYPAAIISLLLVGLMFLLRFLRSYGLLQRQVKVSRFHFFVYIAGVEVLPLLLIYKGLMVLLSKNL